jgi:hypothetical protein
MVNESAAVLDVCDNPFVQAAGRAIERALVKDGSPQGESPRDEANEMPAEECARYIYDATVKRKKIIILTAQGKLTVLMNKWFPGWMDRIVYNVMAKEDNSPIR